MTVQRHFKIFRENKAGFSCNVNMHKGKTKQDLWYLGPGLFCSYLSLSVFSPTHSKSDSRLQMSPKFVSLILPLPLVGLFIKAHSELILVSRNSAILQFTILTSSELYSKYQISSSSLTMALFHLTNLFSPENFKSQLYYYSSN